MPPRGSPGAQCAPLQGVRGRVGFAVGRRVRGCFASLVKGRWPSAARPEGLPYGGLLFERSAVTEGLPYSRHCAVPVWPEAQNLFVGAGFIPPAGVCPTAGFPGARWGWLCGWPQVFPSTRRGGFHIRPQTSRHRKPGRYRIGPYNISTKIFIPPKKPETPPPHTKPKNPKTKKAPQKP